MSTSRGLRYFEERDFFYANRIFLFHQLLYLMQEFQNALLRLFHFLVSNVSTDVSSPLWHVNRVAIALKLDFILQSSYGYHRSLALRHDLTSFRRICKTISPIAFSYSFLTLDITFDVRQSQIFFWVLLTSDLISARSYNLL